MAEEKTKPSADDATLVDETVEETNAENETDELDDLPATDATLMERVLWVRDRVTTLGKDADVGSGSYKYKAISHDKVTAFIRPKMVQAGIFSFISCVESCDIETGAVNDSGRKIRQHQATFEIKFVNANDKDDFFIVRQVAYGDDYGDKAPGKATSYAMKYALLKTFMIETGEEDEDRAADGGRAAVINDDQNMLADLWAVAEECFGEEEGRKMLQDMSERRFFVENYGQIPQERFKDACDSLRKKRQQTDEAD